MDGLVSTELDMSYVREAIAAAYKLGRCCVGVESSETQVAIARRRLQRLVDHYEYGHRCGAAMA